MRKTVFQELGGFDERLRVGEDHNLWLRALVRYPAFHNPESLAVYHRGTGATTGLVKMLFPSPSLGL